MTSIAQHLPALQVVVPLMAAPLTVLLRRPTLAYAAALAAAWASFAIALALWHRTLDGSVISYAIGNWPPPWGIEYRIDRLTSFMLVLVSGIASVVLPYARRSIEREVLAHQHVFVYTMLLLCLTGLLGICATGDAFNVFVFLEISSLSTYVLIALGRDRRAPMAAFQYLIMGTIGATFFVIGVGMLYLMTGTLNIADMAERIAAVRETRPVLAALAFITVGITLKLALFPLHQWLPNAYTFAPSVVSAFLAATATKVSIYVLVRFYFTVFGASQVFGRLPMGEVLLVLALLGMFAASTIAIFQPDLRRLFAYSSVAQIGYIVLGISMQSTSGLSAGLVHLVNHGITKGAVFLLLGMVVMRVGSARLERVRGLGRLMPWTSFGLVVAGLSLVGVPGTAGFVSKWYLILAALERGQWWLVFAIVLSSLLALAYVWRFVEAAYFREPPGDLPASTPSPWSMRVPALVLVAAVVFFGLHTAWTVEPAQAAAKMLLAQVAR